MARNSIIIFPQSKATSHLKLFKSVSRVLSPVKSREYLSYSYSRLRSPASASVVRFLCYCSGPRNDHIDMSSYQAAFSKRMAMAGIKPHHRIALGVSGGPDSMALCVLAALWKIEGYSFVKEEQNEFIEGLLAIVVDHGLRAESKDEANLVQHRVIKMGIRCEIAQCEWLEGRPKQGHLQEAAREKRYEILQNVCLQHQISVLMIAHHADDQAELFIIRLSRNSGVLGLAGMAFTSELFPKFSSFGAQYFGGHGMLLVRPLLEFTKNDMYKICRGGKQDWVEDPTNQSLLYVRNRVRTSLNDSMSSIVKDELKALISACRRTRMHVDIVCLNLIQKTVTVMPQGYAVIDIQSLEPIELKDTILSKFAALVLQFVSQRHRPVRGSASKLILDYFRTVPCKTSLTAAGCYLCPAPGYKGTKVLVCCAFDFNATTDMSLTQVFTDRGDYSFLGEVEEILSSENWHPDQSIPCAMDVHFLDGASSHSVLTEAKKLHIISEPTYRAILSLQIDENKHFTSLKAVVDSDSRKQVQSGCMTWGKELYPGQLGYFMNRFLVKWNLGQGKDCYTNFGKDAKFGQSAEKERPQYCILCGLDQMLEVRPMVDDDWLYLAKLSKNQDGEELKQEIFSGWKGEQDSGKLQSCMEHAKLSAQRALISLKSIPAGARRSMPVLVDSQGLLFSIPSVCFTRCPFLSVSADFKPRIPLGGGHSSFL